jgi:hypothetical protein
MTRLNEAQEGIPKPKNECTAVHKTREFLIFIPL